MKLTNSNYYSDKANQEYISVSQYKDFFGTLERKGCESKALAKIRGDLKEEPTVAMLIGSYIDSYFEGTLDEFKERTPQIFKKDGTLKAEYIHAETMIERCKQDKMFMRTLSGEKQVIMTAELFGAKWKIKMDSYIPNSAIVDLKTVDDIYKGVYCDGTGKLNFIQAKGYDLQLAIYQKVVELNTGKQLPCFIAAVDKTKSPAIEIIGLTQSELDSALYGVQYGVERILKLKSGEIEPTRCERCDWCKSTKVIKSPIRMDNLLTINDE